MNFHSQAIFKRIFLILSIVFSLSYLANAQSSSIIIRGTVVDSATRAPIANVSVYFKGSGGVRTDSSGHYSLIASQKFLTNTHLEFSYIGYKTSSLNINFNVAEQEVNMALNADSRSLQDVTVGNTKRKYRNKGNPAVELIRQVIAHRDENRMNSYEYAQYSEYDKMVMSISNFSEKIKDSKFMQKYKFLLDNQDTTTVPGKSIVPIYLDEVSSQNYYRKKPENSKKIITGHNTVDFGDFIDTKGITSWLKALYADVDIYDNNITLFTNQFLSPISNMAPTFYMFFLGDTVMIDGVKQVQLSFQPRNPQDMLFRGTMYVTLDGHYAVQRVRLYSPNGINFNFLRSMRIQLDFTRRNDGKYLLTKSDIVGDFGIFKKGMGLYGERVVMYKDFDINKEIPSAIFKGSSEIVQDSAMNQSSEFWAQNRFDTLTRAESLTYQNVDSLSHMKSFRNLMDWLTFFLAGYKQVGPAEVGPANAFYSFNPVEGFRLRLGGRTTPRLSKRYYFEGYGAYGFKDKRWKYFGSATYSINNKSIYQFPQNYVRVSYQKETQIPGQQLQFVQENNFLLSFKRGNNDKWLYNNFFKIDYVKEFQNHFSWDLNYTYWKQFAAGTLAFLYPNQPVPPLSQQSITSSSINLTLRYAPHEIFYQGKIYRVPLLNQHPIFQLKYTAGFKGFLGGQYNYNNIDANIFKRFLLSQFGYADFTLAGGYMFGKLPYPLLQLPHANQTYAYQLQSYNLMNFLEFASDHYVSLMGDYYLNGFLFNKIPLLKKLKFREVVEGKVLYGGLRDENNPAKNPNQMLFPTTNGLPSTFPLGKTPYVEGGFGIMNILKLIRIDYIHRFTYLNHPEIPTNGIRVLIVPNF
ncbi:hypothetical protein A9P82_14960 [Arachidicoccus ginsenosidimutans]|uniref:DUF5686 and carboxypeptidase-like regulatory domain-containing protein n=1 Tax=Arachidicoccus sp. BS20 TaxID=1850526 RepID=UPI0007F164BE|nr:DUF5686 and carboxypeptidase-like regulatory domain-containing protein [Arachidicoccus sp. BS20]ANI90471.1 hypothetical protein A9P82_14960 [Arachidicoccus sp. BS20]